MVTRNSFKGRPGVFTTHNIGIMKAAEKLRKLNAASLDPAQRAIIEEADNVKQLMTIPPPPRDSEPVVVSNAQSAPAKLKTGTASKSKTVQHGKAKI